MAATAPRAYLSLAPGTDRDAALAAIRTAIAGSGVQLLTRQQLVDTDSTLARHLIAVRQRAALNLAGLWLALVRLPVRW